MKKKLKEQKKKVPKIGKCKERAPLSQTCMFDLVPQDLINIFTCKFFAHLLTRKKCNF